MRRSRAFISALHIFVFILAACPGGCGTKSQTAWKDEWSEGHSGRQPWVFPTKASDVTKFKLATTAEPGPRVEFPDEFRPEKVTGGPEPTSEVGNQLSQYFYEVEQTKNERGGRAHIEPTGEDGGGPRAAPGPTVAETPAPQQRKTEPDLQELITGFVKLLHAGSPPPARRRINNRGPPRISDLPPFLLDPAPSTREPPPYPFEKPLHKVVIKPFVSGVPIPEQIVPTPKPSKPASKLPSKPIAPTKSSDYKKTSTFKIPTTMITTTTSSTTSTTTSTEKSSTTEAPTPPPTDPAETITTPFTPDTPRLNLTELFPNTTQLLEPSAASPEPTTTTSAVASPTPTLHSSIIEPPSSKETHRPTKWPQPEVNATKPYKGYSARPGIVLDDPEYKRMGTARPVITASAPPRGDVFDVTVSAIQGPGSTSGTPHVYPVELEGVKLAGAGSGDVSVITKAQAGQHYVSIDGKRTYINLFGSSSTSTAQVKPTPVIKPTASKSTPGSYRVHQSGIKTRPGQRRPLPPVRIDTCIVGDWSTCDSEQHESCRTEHGVSSCHCAPGFGRLSHRQPCKRTVSLFAAIHVDKLYEQKVSWNDKLADRDSPEYVQLEYEAVRAMESALSMTPFSDSYISSKVNSMYSPGRGEVFINFTLALESLPETQRPQVRQEIERHLLGAIKRRNHNLGTSNLWASQTNTISHFHDIDECSSPELNDCFAGGECSNIFGSFECTCPSGYRDEFANNPQRAGRRCETCTSDYCNHRGTCSYSTAGQPTCQCTGNYYGSQCEVDGEVLGVAVGASVAAILIILSTLACLCMWSRKWNKEQKAMGLGSPVFGYMPSGGSTVKTPGIGSPPYQISMEDRLRWAQIAEAMAQSTNHYAQPEPVCPTRPASAMFGYGTLPVAPLPLPRLRPASVHNMRQESSSEEEDRDRADLLGRNFHVPRPKSRASIANQSGIYYDVDYGQHQDHSMKQPAIPLSTYSMGRNTYYRN